MQNESSTGCIKVFSVSVGEIPTDSKNEGLGIVYILSNSILTSLYSNKYLQLLGNCATQTNTLLTHLITKAILLINPKSNTCTIVC